MTPGLSDLAEIAEVELLGGIPQYDGVLRYRFLTCALSFKGLRTTRGGDGVEVGGGASSADEN